VDFSHEGVDRTLLAKLHLHRYGRLHKLKIWNFANVFVMSCFSDLDVTQRVLISPFSSYPCVGYQ